MGSPRFTATSKRCKDCGVVKPVDDFYQTASRTNARQPRCKICHGKYTKAWAKANPERAKAIQDRSRRKGVYGMDAGVFEAMWARQQGLCASCGRPPSGGRGGLHVDHDHDSGQVRGLLCTSCNQGLGRFHHDPELLRRAIAYLERAALSVQVTETPRLL